MSGIFSCFLYSRGCLYSTCSFFTSCIVSAHFMYLIKKIVCRENISAHEASFIRQWFYSSTWNYFNLKLIKKKNWKLVQKMLEPRRQDFFFLFSRLNSSEGLRHGCSRVDPGAHSEFCHWTTESLHHYFRRLLLLVVLYWTDVPLLSMVQFLEVIFKAAANLVERMSFPAVAHSLSDFVHNGSWRWLFLMQYHLRTWKSRTITSSFSLCPLSV